MSDKARVQTVSPDEFGDAKRDRAMRQALEDRPSCVGLFRKVYQGKASPRQAIKVTCLLCLGMKELAIRECTNTACGNWNFRPYQIARHSSKPEAKQGDGA